jgi:hypothetical protein
MSYNIIGIVLLVLGIAILLATLYLGYGLYTAVLQAGAAPQKPASAAVSNSMIPSASAIVSAVVSAIASQMPLAIYTSYAIAAIILALFASIGYKISMIGIHTLALDSERDKKDKSDKDSEKD